MRYGNNKGKNYNFCICCQLLIAAITFFCLSSLKSYAQSKSDADIYVDGQSIGRQYYGVGAISQGASTRLLIDYPEPERSQILDYLFKPGYGASLQFLKVAIGGDSNATDGSEPSHMRGPGQINCNRGWEWWLMKEARKRNPNIKLVAQEWSAPGWIDSVWSQKNIDYQLSWLQCAERHGLKINYIGGWNEKGFDSSGFIKLKKGLEKRFPYVKVPAADQINTWEIADSMAANPKLKKAVDVIAVHFPCSWRSHYRRCHSSTTAKNIGKPLWLAANSAEGWDNGAGPHARALNRMYIDGKMVNYMTWNVAESRYSNLSLGNTGLMGATWPWSGYYQLGKNIWAFAHTTQFTEPGWHYLDSGSKRLDDKATIVSLADSTSQKYSMIIETMDMTRPDTVSVQLKNLPARVLHKWETNIASNDPSDYFQNAGTIVPYKGRFQLILHPNHIYSITSTTGQGKGHARPSTSIHQRMDLPFSENFEGVAHGKMAPLFTSLNGAFEAAPCEGGRSGTCYEQMVRQQPIKWNDSGKMPPTTMVGDPRWWGDYTINTDVFLKKEGYVEVIGRISGQLGWTPYLGGYHFKIGTEGWKLYNEDSPSRSRDTLATGSESISAGKWHHITMKMHANHIEISVDGNRLTTLEDTHQLSGNLALRASKWDNAQFDNVKVTATGPPAQFVPYSDMSIAEVSGIQKFWGGWTFQPENTIDDRLGTEWQSKKIPTTITFDMGTNHQIQALWLRPRRPYFDKNNRMNITKYRIEVSRDGQSFRTVAEGNWPATGSAKIASWPAKTAARFVRLVALKGTGGHASASEIRLIEKLPAQWRAFTP